MKFFRIAIAFLLVTLCLSGIVVTAGAVGEVNINIASKEELMQLEGIGSSYADKIIEYREANGPFEKAEDIMNVKGVGTSTFEKNKDRITVGENEEANTAPQ